MPSAFIIGGSGQIGLAIASRLCDDGWSVELGCRSPGSVESERTATCKAVKLDARQPGALASVISTDYDLVVSCIAFDDADARELLSIQSRIGRIVVISSASVYQDDAGRTLDEAADVGFPEFSSAITENTRTVQAGPETYSTRKIGMENVLLDNAVVPVTVLRPCAIHGPHSKHAREWWFVKRFLDGRTRIPLAYAGRSQFQTTSVVAIADAVVQSSDKRLPAVLNVADSDSPSVMDIGNTIMQSMGIQAELVPLPDENYPPTRGATPWSVQRPFICQSLLNHRVTYAQSVAPAIQWLIESVTNRDWQSQLPQLAEYPRPHFDYTLDDLALTTHIGMG